jgi:hypothetical protein
MPSDERVDQASRILADQRTAFQSALGTTVDQIDHYLADHGGGKNGTADRVAEELGPFGADRIDVGRFSELFQTATLDGRARESIEQARTTMTGLADQKDRLFLADVEHGGDLAVTVGRAFAEIGRAFGAARLFDLARAGQHKDRPPALSLGAFPFQEWSSRERAMSPPLIVTVDGSDLQPAGLAQFMDAGVHIFLLVRGDTAPAPLVRLIMPGTFVQQTHEGTGLDRFAAYDGPAIAAWMPEAAAHFLHDPTADGLTIEHLPAEPPGSSVGGSSVSQQAEELKQLEFLASATAPAAPAALADTASAAPAETVPAAPADKLAAWLLSQADLENVG